MRLSFRSVLFSVFFFSLSLFNPVAAQQADVAVQGIVSDTSGAVVSGATVTAVVAGRAVSRAITSSDGTYRVDVPAGVPTELRVRREGFADQVCRFFGLG